MGDSLPARNFRRAVLNLKAVYIELFSRRKRQIAEIERHQHRLARLDLNGAIRGCFGSVVILPTVVGPFVAANIAHGFGKAHFIEIFNRRNRYGKGAYRALAGKRTGQPVGRTAEGVAAGRLLNLAAISLEHPNMGRIGQTAGRFEQIQLELRRHRIHVDFQRSGGSASHGADLHGECVQAHIAGTRRARKRSVGSHIEPLRTR